MDDASTSLSPQPTQQDNALGWSWLKSTADLQEKVYGYWIMEMAYAAKHPPLPIHSSLPSYLDWNQTAAVQELAELREEFSWKPWAKDRPFANRQRILEEAVDVLHFVGNILTGVGVTDEEFWIEYRRKQALNRARQASGTYSAIKGGISEGSDNT